MIEETRIKIEANQYQKDEYDCGNTGDLARAFTEGVEWAIQELQPKWIDADKEQPEKDEWVLGLFKEVIGWDNKTKFQVIKYHKDPDFGGWMKPTGYVGNPIKWSRLVEPKED